MNRSLPSIDFIDFKISEMSRMAKRNHELLKDMNSFFANISDATIREYYSKYGETMFELELNYFRVNVPDNLERIKNMKGNRLFSINLKPRQIEQLDESENLEKDSLKLLDNIENIIKNIMEKRLNKAIMGTLQDLAREKVRKHNIPPEDYRETAVLYNEYGGFRNRKNKTKNKKYTKKRTYKRPKNVYPRKIRHEK
jgi:hypothetical protein